MDLDCSIVPELNDEPASALMDGDAEVHQYEAGTLVGSFVKHRQGWRGPLAYVSSSACASACFQGFGKGVLDADRGGRAGCDDGIDRGHSADGSAAEKTALPARVKRVHYPLFAAFARFRPVESSRIATFRMRRTSHVALRIVPHTTPQPYISVGHTLRPFLTISEDF